IGRGMEGGKDLVGVMTTAVQTPHVFVAHATDHFQQLRVLAEEVLTDIFAVVRLVGLVFAIDRLFHDAAQNTFFVTLQERIPVATPDELDDIPAAATEVAFKLLNDLAIATYRAVQSLQVAVDDEDQIV